MSKKDPKDGLSDLEYERALIIAQLIKRNVDDIIAVIDANSQSDDIYTSLAAYSSLLAVSSYMEYNLREQGITDILIESTKNSAENYALNLISEERNLGVQKKGDA